GLLALRRAAESAVSQAPAAREAAPPLRARLRMRVWIAARLAQTVLVVVLSLTAVFGMVRLAGDPGLLFMPIDIPAKDANEYRQRLGFNDPVPVPDARFPQAAGRAACDA